MAFFHNKLTVNSLASAGFFLKAPHSTVERKILCPLFSPHPQNQSVENKILSSVSLHTRSFAFRENPYQSLFYQHALLSSPPLSLHQNFLHQNFFCIAIFCITTSSLLRAAITTRHTTSSGAKQTPGQVYGRQAAQALQILILAGKKVEKYFKKGLALI